MILTQARFLSAAATLAFVGAAPALSFAQAPERVLVVPIAAQIPDKMQPTAQKVTAALGAAAQDGGATVSTSEASRAQVTDLADCRREKPACMQEMLDAVSADTLVLGNLVGSEGGWILTVKKVRRGQPDSIETYIFKTVEIPDLDKRIQAIALATFPTTVKAVPVDLAVQTTPEPHSSFSLSQVRLRSWAVAGIGAALAASGGISLQLAAGKQNGVDGAPDSTLDEISRLRSLESTANRYERIGNVLLIAGGATLAAGATLAFLDARSSESSSASTFIVTPVPTKGGAMVTFTMTR